MDDLDLTHFEESNRWEKVREDPPRFKLVGRDGPAEEAIARATTQDAEGPWDWDPPDWCDLGEVACQLCGAADEDRLTEHHVHGRRNSPRTVTLCRSCHDEVHGFSPVSLHREEKVGELREPLPSRLVQ